MAVIKKWKYSFLVLLCFSACKSADCGCPMAEHTIKKERVTKATDKNYKLYIKEAK